MKKNFKAISLLTVLTVMVNLLGVFVMLKPAAALSAGSDTMTSLTAGAATDNHVVAFTTTGTGAITITFTGFSGTPVATGYTAGSDLALNPTLTIASSTAGAQSVIVTGLTNPAFVSSYTVVVAADGGSLGIQVPIVDSDTVNVTGYITSSIYFDLDTNTDNGNCAFSTCLKENGVGALAAANYTVDLGQLTTLKVNASAGIGVLSGNAAGIGATETGAVTHADTVSGTINSIYFDLSSNAASGVSLTYSSLNQRLDGPGDNAHDIPSVVAGADITQSIAAYGIQLINSPAARSFGGLTNVVNTNCAATGHFCSMTSVPQTIYSTNGSIEAGRGRIDVAAAISGLMPPGTYTDVITFIATAQY